MTEKDIERIDYIIDRLIQLESTVCSNDLHRDRYYDEFNDDKKKIEQNYSLLMLTLSELMVLDKISTKHGESIKYTPEILKFKNTYGSFKNYYLKIQEQFVNNESESQKEKERQVQKDKIDALTLKELKHKETIRAQEDRIRDLNEKLTTINLIKAYKWYLGFLISIGIVLGYFLSWLIIE